MAQIDARQSLKDRLDWIRDECEAYDQGKLNRAVFIALNVRALVHEKKNTSHKNDPVLKQLDPQYRSSIQLASSLGTDFDAQAKVAPHHYGLIRIKQNLRTGEAFIFPRLQCDATYPAGYWWDEQSVLAINGTRYTRRMIVLTFADQFAAHSDREIDDAIAQDLIETVPRTPIQIFLPSALPVLRPMKDLYLPALREIGYELLESRALDSFK